MLLGRTVVFVDALLKGVPLDDPFLLTFFLFLKVLFLIFMVLSMNKETFLKING